MLCSGEQNNKYFVILQLELQANESLQTYWKKLRKREAKAAKEAAHVPIQQRPEVTFLPSLMAEFLEVSNTFYLGFAWVYRTLPLLTALCF